MQTLGKGDREGCLARHEQDFQAGAEQPLSMDELLHLLGADDGTDTRARRHAIACYLSGADGWRDALKELRGAFAKDGAGLKRT